MNRREFLTSVIALAMLPAKTLASSGTSSDEILKKTMPLAVAASKAGLLYGSPLFPNELNNSKYLKLFKNQVSILTNTVYMSATQPTESTWNLDGFERVRKFAIEQKLNMRGHPLVWHNALPGWVNSVNDPKDLKEVIHSRIKKLVGLYKGEFQSWDVVNEAIDATVKSDDHLTPCVWAKVLGVEYLDYAFHIAHQTDPKPLYTYNDYGTEDDSEGSLAKREAIFSLVQGMLKRKVPIKAVGLQSHLYGGASYKTLPDWISRLKSLGLHVFITELDVTDIPFPADKHERDKLVAQTYSDFLTSALSTGSIDIVLNWGLANPYSWLQTFPFARRKDGLPSRPLPFGNHLEPMPAYYAIESAFLSAPRHK